jgi:hypothetical protein
MVIFLFLSVFFQSFQVISTALCVSFSASKYFLASETLIWYGGMCMLLSVLSAFQFIVLKPTLHKPYGEGKGECVAKTM